MLSNLLTGSWKTTVVGIAEAVLAFVFEEMRNGGGFPQDAAGWLIWGGGILRALAGFVQKDHNKTNAPVPVETPNTIPMLGSVETPKTLVLLILPALVFACAPIVEVHKMGNEYVQDAHSRNWWGPNWHRVTYCWKLEQGFCPKEDIRVEVASKIGMDAPGQQMAVGAVQSMPLALGIGLGLAHSGSRITQSVGGFTVNEQFSTKFIGQRP